MKTYIIKVINEERYIYQKANKYCIAYRDTIAEAKKFKTLQDAQKYIDGYIPKFEIIEINI